MPKVPLLVTFLGHLPPRLRLASDRIVADLFRLQDHQRQVGGPDQLLDTSRVHHLLRQVFPPPEQISQL